MQILDFGCGVGRVALPCFYKYKKPSSCVDVDPACIAYLQRVIPDAGPQTITFDPPAPFVDETFDCIYAISVWTHLDPETSDRWMKEIIRILKPGGIALITTTNYPGLEARRQLKRDWVWKTVSDDDLRESGTIFHRHGATSGITGIYGNAAHDPEWLRREWSARYMPVVDIVSGGILGVQDINVMKRQERQ
jgi:SAM-dependent methyltransferase